MIAQNKTFNSRRADRCGNGNILYETNGHLLASSSNYLPTEHIYFG